MNQGSTRVNTQVRAATTTRPVAPTPSTTKADNGYINLLKKIKKDSYYTYVDAQFKLLSPFEMRQALAPDETGALAETYLTRSVPVIEGLRNALVVAPITITWLSLAIAASAYQQSVALLPSGATAPSFFQLWQQGFPQLQMVQLGFWTFHLTPGHSHFFAFSNIAFADFLILTGMLLLTALAQILIASASYRSRQLQLWLEEKLFTWSVNSLTWGPRPDVQDATWAGKVEDALRRLDAALAGVRESLGEFNTTLNKQGTFVQSMLSNSGDITKTVSELTGIYKIMHEGSREITNTLPRVAENISAITRGQQSTSDTWRHAADQLDIAARSLATLTSSLTGDPRYQEEADRVRQRYTASPPPYPPSEPSHGSGFGSVVTSWWRRVRGG